jgi:hypothetical protein
MSPHGKRGFPLQGVIMHICDLKCERYCCDIEGHKEFQDGICIHCGYEEDPTPWCSYGHKTASDCDCGPIAEND